MSSSLFADCYIPYETYPETVNVDGDKKFGDLKNGDTLYLLCRNGIDYSLKELVLVKPWHQHNGNYYITCLDGKKKVAINFGTTCSWNVKHISKQSSIVTFGGDLIGTNKDSVIEHKRHILLQEAKYRLKEYEAQKAAFERFVASF